MNYLKCIINKLKKFNTELDNKHKMSWMEYRRQWLLENDTWTCKNKLETKK